ncbi:MAG TPA: AbrB/MazE/SpoVT family DNA-binding domain-containing protein [Thermoanaerobaculia bacterium]|nr:AbrB/MazE/SpoVT family DNA-binding domain-containing protein [Thermoanaerobaculia bacterium]
MTIATSRLTAQGQISVPAEIRRKLGLGPGSVLEWEQEGDKILIRRAGRYSSEDLHRAVFNLPPEPHTLEELKEGIRTHIKKRHARG